MKVKFTAHTKKYLFSLTTNDVRGIRYRMLIAESTLVDMKAKLQSSQAQPIKLHDSRNEVEELQFKVAALTSKAATFESNLSESNSQLAISHKQVEVLNSRLSVSENATSQA